MPSKKRREAIAARAAAAAAENEAPNAVATESQATPATTEGTPANARTPAKPRTTAKKRPGAKAARGKTAAKSAATPRKRPSRAKPKPAADDTTAADAVATEAATAGDADTSAASSQATTPAKAETAPKPRRKRVRASRSKAAIAARAQAGANGTEASQQQPNEVAPAPETTAATEQEGAEASAGTPSGDAGLPDAAMPSHFSVRTDRQSQRVAISRGGRSTSVPMASYASVAAALSVLSPEDSDIPANSVIEMFDHFSDRRAKVTVASLPHVLKAMSDLLGGEAAPAEAAQAAEQAAPEAIAEAPPSNGTAQPEAGTPARRKRVRPSRAKAKAATAAPAEAASTDVGTEAETPDVEATPAPSSAPAKRKRIRPSRAKAKAQPEPQAAEAAGTDAAAPARASSGTPAKRKRVRPSRAKPKAQQPTEATDAKRSAPGRSAPKAPPAAASEASGEMPGWFAALDETVETNGGFELRRAAMALDRNAKYAVAGRAGEADGTPAWGYEVVADGDHVAWIIAENPKSFILTGAPGMKWSKHAILNGVVARVTAQVMPLLKQAA